MNDKDTDSENEEKDKLKKLSINTKVKQQQKQQQQDGNKLKSPINTGKSPCSNDENERFSISPLTIEKTTAAKVYFEQYFDKINKNGPVGRTRRQQQLEEEMENKKVSNIEKRIIRKAFISKERIHMRSIREKMSIDDFKLIKTIGHGAFGIVKLVREKSTGEVYAVKVLRKSDMIKRHQEMHVRAERDLLSEAAFNSKWIIQLMYSFQDEDYLYFVLEFMAGGDLLSLLIKMDIFTEDFAKFYSAEMVMCIEEAHKLGVVHRDIKPDNFLFDAKGHIRLSDFGLATDFHWSHNSRFYDFQRQQTLACAKEFNDAVAAQNEANVDDEDLERELENYSPPKEKVLEWRDKNRKNLAFSVVGTQNYTAPEVFLGTGTDQACDWWSLGVIIFEMLYGYPPFCSRDKATTKLKIINWKKSLQLPKVPEISSKAKSFILSLCCDKEDRLGSHQKEGHDETDATEIKKHPWFSDIDFDTLAEQKPPFKPYLKSDTDTSYFEEVDEEEVKKNWDLHLKNKKPAKSKTSPTAENSEEEMIDMKKKLAFVGFTFKNPYKLNCESLVESNNLTANMSNLNIQERRMSKESGIKP
ncbi:kinase-like protein [Piromyces finnis]|uniref:non-specific serine/threonine protein kinase n=1 Tax=Piromyces finnis TaxID=1754191 RepID=A0A1Y1VD45_9FUNG|nr:kinase-like protein [Piromyces finnis]|eukprot:ORX51767.1 kinase-like protein [Piromyces finnis]